MKNEYRVKGNKVYIILPAVNGRQPLPETEVVIDLRNFTKVQEYPGTWFQTIHPVTGKLFARGRCTRVHNRNQPYLSKIIGKPGLGEKTYHIDGDHLNCLESNLVNAPIGTQDVGDLTPIGEPPEPEKKQESQEEIKPVKGVSFHKGKKRWEVKLYYQGQRHNLGYWPEYQLKEANEAADFFRENGPEAYKEKFKGG